MTEGMSGLGSFLGRNVSGRQQPGSPWPAAAATAAPVVDCTPGLWFLKCLRCAAKLRVVVGHVVDRMAHVRRCQRADVCIADMLTWRSC
jgi:hypothetical protein